jgi:hypothetical protein
MTDFSDSTNPRGFRLGVTNAQGRKRYAAAAESLSFTAL